jgi:hypothetical protein
MPLEARLQHEWQFVTRDQSEATLNDSPLVLECDKARSPGLMFGLKQLT